MKYKYCAYSPHHVTAFFSPKYTPGDTLTTGSIGAGIVVEPGVTACTGGETKIPTDTARKALKLLNYKNGVYIREPLPVGVGYASSAATAISASLAISVHTGSSIIKSLQAAHIAEVELSTGLGDVLAISCGVGIAVRIRPGAPGVGSVDCFQIPGSISILSLEWGRMHTARLIDALKGYSREAEKSLERLIEHMSFEVFIEEAERFSEATKSHGILGRNRDIIKRTPGLIGFYTKKTVTIIFVEDNYIRDSIEYLANYKLIPRILEPSVSPPKVWVERIGDSKESSKV
ncbi:MAG: hypothetical protein F7C81_03120 [Desulfurococcales archaeon]|nr:hypothetical protein [Desulfurococcales archaeon]